MAAALGLRSSSIAFASLTLVVLRFAERASALLVAQPVRAHNADFQPQDPDLASLLQSSENTEQAVNVRFFLGSHGEQDREYATTTLVPKASDFIQQAFWKDASKVLEKAGLSTPMPQARLINAPPTPPTPLPWQNILDDPSQPLDTKLGGAVMTGLIEKPTMTPPPTQEATNMEFVAQCPMVLFDKNLSIRGGGCDGALGSWVDPNPANVRTVLRWKPIEAGGLFFGVDSAISGPGTAEFSEVKSSFTISSSKFSLVNCLGTDRYHLEEEVFKVDSMGHVQSTIDTHDISTNGEAFFLKYLVKTPTGKLVSESNLFRMNSNQVNYTEIKDGVSTGRLLAIATRQGNWKKKGWEKCMSPTSPRGWSVYFPQNKKSFDTVATVQDVRVAIASAITLMAYRDENRGADGLNTQGSNRQLWMLIGGVAMICMIGILFANCCMVFQASGIKEKLRRVLFESEGAFLPKRPHNHRAPPFHPTY